MKNILLGLLLVVCIAPSWGQYYMFGGYNFGAVDLQNTNAIVRTFNQNENHQIGNLTNNFHGYRVGLGKYAPHTILELGFGNLISKQQSTTPNQLRENAEVVANYMSVSARFGYKPFKHYYFTVGAALHLGGQSTRYSFGGDYQTPVLEYTIAPELYADYAFRIKFLLKKAQRDKYFYLLRIRPYYQLQQLIPIGQLDNELNNKPLVKNDAIKDSWTHFGFNISIVIPFIPTSEADQYLLPTKKEGKEPRKKKNKRRYKQKSNSGRL